MAPFSRSTLQHEARQRRVTNGGRLRLAPQKDWAVNDPAEVAKVVETLEGIQQGFDGGLFGGDKKVSVADLIVLGGAAAIEKAAKDAGYEVAVVDPRTAFATAERFPQVELVRSWPTEALAELGLDRRTALVTVTHDPKLDDPALQAALASDVFYIGALGSRRTHAKRLERLREAGFDEQGLDGLGADRRVCRVGRVGVVVAHVGSR